MGAEKSEGNSFFRPHISALASGFTLSRSAVDYGKGENEVVVHSVQSSDAAPYLVSGNSFWQLVQWHGRNMGAEKSEGNSFFCPHISALASGLTFSRSAARRSRNQWKDNRGILGIRGN